MVGKQKTLQKPTVFRVGNRVGKGLARVGKGLAKGWQRVGKGLAKGCPNTFVFVFVGPFCWVPQPTDGEEREQRVCKAVSAKQGWQSRVGNAGLAKEGWQSRVGKAGLAQKGVESRVAPPLPPDRAENKTKQNKFTTKNVQINVFFVFLCPRRRPPLQLVSGCVWSNCACFFLRAYRGACVSGLLWFLCF